MPDTSRGQLVINVLPTNLRISYAAGSYDTNVILDVSISGESIAIGHLFLSCVSNKDKKRGCSVSIVMDHLSPFRRFHMPPFNLTFC